MRSRVQLVRGALAATIALGALAVAHAASATVPLAPLSLADRVVRLTPGGLATWAIERFQHAALWLLAGGVGAALVVAGALLAWLVARTRAPTLVAAGGFGALVALADALDPVPARAVAQLAVAALGGLLYGAVVGSPAARAGPDPLRRELLRVGGTAAAGVVAGAALGRIASALSPASHATIAAAGGERAPDRRLPRIPGLSPEVTSVADHYVVDIDLQDPIVDAAGWQLEVGGLVDRPMTLGFEELQRRFALVDEHATLTCISNEVGGPLVGSSAWTGVRLRDVLAAARPRAGAVALRVECADGYSAGIPLTGARHPSALVALGQDGETLSRAHGFPCRLRVPALYGMLNPKWVRSIELVDRPYLGYWAQQGWSPTAVVRTESRIDTPRSARVGQPTWIAGVAWAGIRGIAAVEASTDGGRTWSHAVLQPPRSPWAWTQWAWRWTPRRPGRYELACRATDGTGRGQDSAPRRPHPSGASGYHRIAVDVT
ncbi:MAG TPA: molybdopterin-dependent oxidoreductase [Solirubrobacteraceae bacterium]